MEVAVPKVSIIVVNFNAGRWLKPCVETIIAQTESEFECFIVDNGSEDDSLSTLPKLDKRFKIIELGYNAGFAVANNHAAQLANSDWVALLNPDAFARPDWLEKLLKATTLSHDIKMVGSTQFLALAETPTLDGVGDCYHASGIAYRAGYGKTTVPPATGLVFGPCGAAALYHRETFLRLGGFDEGFFCYHEDVDLAFRLQLTGSDCIQSSDAIVDHVSSAIAKNIPNFAIYHGTRNRIWTFFKNMPWPLFILLLPAHIFANLAYLYWALFRKGRFKPTLQGIRDALKGMPDIFAQRRKIQKTRTISSLSLMKKFTWSPIKVVTRGIHIRKLP
jgi:GT2 family glycosyltransferase